LDEARLMGGDHTHAANERSVAIAALLTGAFMAAEVVGGVISGSLALLADAGHMLTDFASLALAWIGFRLARRPADWKRTYGFDRFSVLVAFVNGLALFVVAGVIGLEAWRRLSEPVEVLGGLMFWIALLGLFVNLAAFAILRQGDRENLNIRAAVLHVAGDLLGSIAAIVASLVILATGWMAIDPLLSILVALVILRAAWHVVQDSGHILLEGVPEHLDIRAISQDLIASIDDVEDVHHVHAWSITQERPMVTLHATLRPGSLAQEPRAAIRSRLLPEFCIAHATIEIEQGDAERDRQVLCAAAGRGANPSD
jgi:cobalt-zinc-cadmium efflux system protein